MINNDNENSNKTRQFERLLTNLIDIQKLDSAIYTKIDDKFFFDLFLLLSPTNFDKVINEPSTTVPLQNYNIDELIKILSNTSELQEIKDLVSEMNLDWSSNLINKFSTDFENTKQDQIELLTKKRQTSLANWKSFIKKASDINKNKNVWPIHIGFIYISLNVDDKKIFAPLFVKEANVTIGPSGPTLVTENFIKVNHKIIAFLKKINFEFPLNFDFSQLSIANLIKTFANIVSYHFKISNLMHKVPTNLVFRNQIEFQPGFVLGLFNVSGNYQHKILEKMIQNNEIQNQIKVEINKNYCKNKVEKIILSNTFSGFFRIQPTNFIQDYAHVSSLLQNTIIWGPPGTGKSQVIANIIANIIILQKKAIVSSQKQAALTVLRKRLKKMSLFCLFVVNDKSENYKNFYEPIQEYIEWIENFGDQQEIIDSLSIFSELDKEYVKIVNKIFSNYDLVDSKLQAYEKIKEANSFFSLNIAETIFKLNRKININPSESPKKNKKLRINILEKMWKRKLKWYEKISNNFKKTLEKDIELILDKLQNYNGNLSDIFEKIQNLELSNLADINDFLTLSFPEINQTSDDKKLFAYHCSKIIRAINSINSNQNIQELYRNFRMSVKQDNKLLPQQFLLKHFEIIKILFPIIITTPDTELTMFEKEYFDYLIIDEASQMFLEEAFPLMYLAKTKIFAGDKQQMQPIRWFASKSLEQYEDDAFGNIDSLLEYAHSIGVFSVLLDKNYRSKNADLMTFNSKHFYNSDLKVANHFSDSINHSIEVINVQGSWNNQTNIEEAELVVELAQKNISKFKKIILLSFNAAQQNVIEKIIFNSYPELEKLLSKGSLIVNNLENIQGEEADLLIMSVVYDRTTSLASTYIARKGGKHALNVATSRAKEKMIICKSILSEDIVNNSNSKDLEIFKQWISFLDLSKEEKISYANKDANELEKNTKNKRFINFQNDLIQKLSQLPIANLSIEKDYKIGNLTIDVVVMDKKNKMVIGFCLTTFEQTNEIDYAIFNDKINFIKAKNYPIEVIDYINWQVNQKALLNKIYEKIKEHSEK